MSDRQRADPDEGVVRGFVRGWKEGGGGTPTKEGLRAAAIFIAVCLVGGLLLAVAAPMIGVPVFVLGLMIRGVASGLRR